VHRAFDEIAEQVRQRIYDGELKPGDKLPPERDLATQFGVGRMLVREALRKLEEGGFIETRKGNGGGVFIRNIDASVTVRSLLTLIQMGKVSIHDLTEARLWLETLVVEQAAKRRTQEDLRNMEEAIRDRMRILEEGRMPRTAALEFHVHLARAAKNPIFVMLVQSLMEVARPFIDRLNPDTARIASVSAHFTKILEAVRDKDVARARKAVRNLLLDVDKHLSVLPD